MNQQNNQNQNPFHIPVLFNDVMEYLNIEKNRWYVDATAGGGGYIRGILDRGGNVIAIDQDNSAIEHLREIFKKEIVEGKLKIIHKNFSQLISIISETKVRKVAGIIFDLGMSTYQIKQSGRGFSFLRDEPLDMRMSQENERGAAELLNEGSEEELLHVIERFGEEIYAREMVDAIIEYRKTEQFKTTQQIAKIAQGVYGRHHLPTIPHPGTKLFQAIRIAVNGELTHLQEVLPQIDEVLDVDGRCVIISFHSLEDRLVKQFFIQKQTQGKWKIITHKPIRADDSEIERNPASRSAKLRAAQKV